METKRLYQINPLNLSIILNLLTVFNLSFDSPDKKETGNASLFISKK